jgi:hypothetical protein
MNECHLWEEYQDMTPEERLDRIAEILAEGVLRLINEKKTSSANINTAGIPSNSSGYTPPKTNKRCFRKALTSI